MPARARRNALAIVCKRRVLSALQSSEAGSRLKAAPTALRTDKAEGTQEWAQKTSLESVLHILGNKIFPRKILDPKTRVACGGKCMMILHIRY
jgi:hypothetical protein